LGFLFSYGDWISKWVWLSVGSASLCLGIHAWLRLEVTSIKDIGASPYWHKLFIVCVICCAYVVMHYALFPALFTRYFIASYFFMFLSLFATLTRLYIHQLRASEQIVPSKELNHRHAAALKSDCPLAVM